MYGIYGDMVVAAEKALESFGETEALLEYPEVQADKAYYLSVLKKYNELKFLKDKLSALKTALEEEQAAALLLSEAKSDDERTAIYEEISRLKRTVAACSASLADSLGCKHVKERAYCRFKCKAVSSKFAAALYSLIKSDLTAHGGVIEEEKIITAKGGYIEEISFIAEGYDVITRLIPLTGAHKVFAGAKSEELCFAVTPSSRFEKPQESDFKIDVFRSTGAGGQNINKVETAVRVTHLPTGIVVTCQDERSQLRNKERALETIEKRLKEQSAQAEKGRMEADIRAQYAQKHTPVSFDAVAGTLSDTRLSAFSKIPFPFDGALFTSYINGLIAL